MHFLTIFVKDRRQIYEQFVKKWLIQNTEILNEVVFYSFIRYYLKLETLFFKAMLNIKVGGLLYATQV